MREIVKTDSISNFCGGCNNSVMLQKFVVVDEGESFETAWERRHENEDDSVFKRTRFMGFCLCGNIWLK